MAVEKLVMMNVVGKNSYIDCFIKDVLKFESVQLVDAYNEIEHFRFSMNVTEKNIEEIAGFSQVESGVKIANPEELQNKLKLLDEVFGDQYTVEKKVLDENINLRETIKTVDQIYNEVHKKYKILKLMRDDLDEIDNSIRAYKYLSSSNIEMEKVNSMENFDYSLGTLTKENVNRLKSNYGNITAIVVHVGSLDENEVYLVIWPKEMETETKRILKSLSFNVLKGLKREYTKKPAEIVEWLEEKKSNFLKKVKQLEDDINTIKVKNQEKSNYAYNVLKLYKKINDVKKFMALSDEHFYFSGWIPKRMKSKVLVVFSKYEDINVMFNDQDDNPNNKPPTKLKNNWLFKPFEYMVKMYGVPSYDEVDPTPFLSISYLILFGFMFGDFGQGAVFLLLGILLRKKGVKLGGILSRLGISSMFFGLLYGSLFGFETVIPALWMKPFENINKLLFIAIGIGVLMILIGYIYGIINQVKIKDYYNTFLSKNGLAGMVLYLSLILIAIALFTANRMISVAVLTGIVVLLLGLLFMKEPIIDKLSHRKENKLDSSFFVESFFEVFEIILSIFSNTLSFIRVGAFALNHVGLFIAFESLAALVNSGVGSALIYVVGNLFIIVLEGLIVGIQVLRLEYYELFSKYFIGGGKEFNPIKY